MSSFSMKSHASLEASHFVVPWACCPYGVFLQPSFSYFSPHPEFRNPVLLRFFGPLRPFSLPR